LGHRDLANDYMICPVILLENTEIKQDDQALSSNLLTSICSILRFIVERSYVLTIDYFLSDLFVIVMNLTAA